MFRYKIDVLGEFRKIGISANQLVVRKIWGESTNQDLRTGEMVGMKSLDKICSLLKLPIEDVIEHVDEGTWDDKIKG